MPRIAQQTRGVTADRLFTNMKVSDLVAKAETEQSDYRRTHAINVFFSPKKQFDFKWRASREHFSAAFMRLIPLSSRQLARLLTALYFVISANSARGSTG
jgi:hypothetical protein